VARSENMRPGLIQLLEQSSVYAHRTSAPHPNIYSYRTVVLTGTTFKILSVIREAGLDFTGRTNFLAHHLVFEPGESLGKNSPAEILLFWDGWKSSWEGEPESLPPVSMPLVQTLEPPAKNWDDLMGDAALAASPYAFSAGCWWISGRLEETKILILMGESLRLSATIDELWSRSFTTYLGQILDPQQYSWKGWNGQDPRIAPAMNQKAELYLDTPQSLPEGPAKQKNIAKNGLIPIGGSVEAAVQTNMYNRASFKDTPKTTNQEAVKGYSVQLAEGQYKTSSREFRQNKQTQAKGYESKRNLGVILVLVLSILSIIGGGTYFFSNPAKEEQENKEESFFKDVLASLKLNQELPNPPDSISKEKSGLIKILKETVSEENSAKLKIVSQRIKDQEKSFKLDEPFDNINKEYNKKLQEKKEHEKVLSQNRKKEEKTDLELRKIDDSIDKEKTSEKLVEGPRNESNITTVISTNSLSQLTTRQLLLKELVQAVTGNTNELSIPDDIPTYTIIKAEDRSTRFNKIEIIDAFGSKTRLRRELKDYSIDPKDDEQVFINFPPNNSVWFGLNKDDKTNSLIFIIPKSIPPINIDAENKKKLGQIIEQACVIVGDSTNLQINGTAFDLTEVRKENSEIILKKYKDKARTKNIEKQSEATNSILSICKESSNRINQAEVFKRSAQSKATNFSDINSFAKGWLKDGNDLIPRNNLKWRTGTNVFEISSLKDIGTAERLQKAFPERFNDTTKSSFSVYRASAQELINQERAKYFLLPINEDLDQISSNDFSQKYEIIKEDLKNAEAIKEYKRKIDDTEMQLKEDEQRQDFEIKIWSSRSADSHILQFNVKGE